MSTCVTDCKGLICGNGGIMELATCTCKCPRIYTGTNCQTCKYMYNKGKNIIHN